MKKAELDQEVKFSRGRISGRVVRVLEIDSSASPHRYLVAAPGMDPIWCHGKDFVCPKNHNK